LAGVRDIKAVESALDRAQDLAAYGKPPPDIADLAAVYICGIASNHGFNDGYKRTAWVIGRLFLAITTRGLCSRRSTPLTSCLLSLAAT